MFSRISFTILFASIGSVLSIIGLGSEANAITLSNPDFQTIPAFPTGTNFGNSLDENVAGDFKDFVQSSFTPSFTVDSGISSFLGSIGTGSIGDSSDAFQLIISPEQQLTSVAFTFGTNLSPSNFTAIRQGVKFLITESSGLGSILLELTVPGNPAQQFSPLLLSSQPSFFLNPGIYNVLVDSGVLATNNNQAVGYQIDFTVASTSTPAPIPTPALLPGLMGMGIAAIRKRKAEQKGALEV